MSQEPIRPAGRARRRLAGAASLSLTIALALSPLRPTLAASPTPTTGPSPATLAGTPGPTAPLHGTIVYEREDRADDPATTYAIAADGTGQQVLLAASTFYCCPQISPDGSRVAASISKDDRISVVTVDTDGSDRFEMPLPDSTLMLAPGLWLNADEVTFTGWDDSDPSRNGIYVADPRRPETLRQVTTKRSAQDQVLAVSGDGSRLAFVRSAGGDTAGPLFTIDADGSNEQQVSPSDALVSPDGGWGGMPATFSPDGSQLAFAATVDTCACTVYVVDADGGNAKQIYHDAHGLTFGAHFSPDGRWIAFESTDKSNTWDQVMLIHPDGTGLTAVTAGGSEGSWGPQWSPDGSRLVFQHGSSGGDTVDLWTAKPDGSDLVQLTHDPGHYHTYSWGAWSPAGH